MSANWLILETSGRVARVGLARGTAVTHTTELDTSRRHAREMVPTIEAMLKTEALRPTDLTGIMVCRGPGSYTGLRVGLATAKALAYATGCQLRAVDTFAAIAEQTPPDARHVWVIADALQNQVYLQRFDRTETGWVPFQELRIALVDEWVNGLSTGDHLSGPGVSVYAKAIPQSCNLVAEANREARIESVLAVGLRLVPLTREELFALEPLYLRGSSAEEKAKAT
ncbi:tRNA (adenosine(37)-N6)-threonylcarbamoyltransferase complex dimerization subunit type 1 TsaB [Frigoriglobus tundricola]|uniref:tRNA threonylcarbamoyladenosine biosynthesis protein TsaB n=1 Tax=Frigoriglobus tundricola TaxID=2774151 RepID=A0A6M5YVQ4_9BACT|nr:tRNA (adenosine(37)-N6)-threonylcarbamoyltransferase complex dimerization subunit type 1 TsaB [Frigoriglobus tundricola]QJW97381.1 tRNA threonylcarbamoyladenosine biosynthesis protein TsaB [Frigoriglobus tundricola]